MKENYTYPVVLKSEGNKVIISFPDFPDHMTEAETEDKAIFAAQEVLALCIYDNEEKGISNPVPSNSIGITQDSNTKLVFVNIWMPYYRQIQKIVYVKKTLSIPQWLDNMAKAKNVNFSAILVKGLKSELGLSDDK